MKNTPQTAYCIPLQQIIFLLWRLRSKQTY